MKPRSQILSQRENIKEHKKENWRVIQPTKDGRALVLFYLSGGRLKLQEPEGRSKKSWIKTKTGKKDRVEKRNGSAVAARGHFRSCHLLPRIGALSVTVSKPVFKKQAMSLDKIHILPGKNIWVCQHWVTDHSTKHALSFQGNKFQVSCFQRFCHSIQEEINQYGVTYDC